MEIRYSNAVNGIIQQSRPALIISMPNDPCIMKQYVSSQDTVSGLGITIENSSKSSFYPYHRFELNEYFYDLRLKLSIHNLTVKFEYAWKFKRT